jgi:hypothetical protein
MTTYLVEFSDGIRRRIKADGFDDGQGDACGKESVFYESCDANNYPIKRWVATVRMKHVRMITAEFHNPAPPPMDVGGIQWRGL